MPEWAFLTNHALVPSLISRHARIIGLDLAGELGVTKRAARELVAELHENGYIKKKKEGRRIRYSINPDQPLRQDIHSDIPVGSLLETLGWKRKRKPLSKRNKSNINTEEVD